MKKQQALQRSISLSRMPRSIKLENKTTAPLLRKRPMAQSMKGALRGAIRQGVQSGITGGVVPKKKKNLMKAIGMGLGGVSYIGKPKRIK